MSFGIDNHSRALEGEDVHRLFEERVKRDPGAIAIVSGEQQLTYGELNGRANQLARHLLRLAVGPEVLVAVCVRRSIEMVASLLAVLKAGGAYVPLDPSYPQHRLQFVLEDTLVPLLLTEKALLPMLPATSALIVCLDDPLLCLNRESEDDFESVALPRNLAYVIYTSGSTGKPKGVAIERRSVVALIEWAKTIFATEGSQGVLASTSISFDLSVFELLVTLALGHCVILAENVLHLANLKSTRPVTLINTVPSAIAELLDLRAIPETVTTVNLAGEPLKNSLVAQLHQLNHVQRVFDLYGPSEDTTYSTFASRVINGPNTIGQPISNTEVYILDADRHPLLDAVGEIYLGGRGLARGYLNRPDLTAERFIPNPFSSKPGARLYRTGDLGRYLPDGDIEYLGRVDTQIKLRGFRIELREIELRLAEYPLVRDCAVVAQERPRGDRFLAAYVVTDQSLDLNELRDFLKQELPDYMIPSAFVRIDKLPLTANGKLDRRALTEPLATCTLLEKNCELPRDEIEEQLKRIFEEALGLDSVSTTANFFESGGDSLIAAHLFSEIEKQFGARLPLATLFEAATISKLAAIIRSGSVPSWSSLVPIQPKGSKPPLFCVHGCGAHVFVYRPLTRRLGEDQPIYGLQPRGLDGKQSPYNRVEEMASHYINEVLHVQPRGPYYLVGDTLGGLIAFEMAQQLIAQGKYVALLAMFDTFCPLSLSFGPRVASHFSHLKKQGLGQYLHAGAESVKKRLGKASVKTSEVMLPKPEQDYANASLAANDPVQRTEWAIYMATVVNYRLPRRYPGKLTYFLARDNQYESSFEDNRLLWKKRADRFEVHVIPGRHNTIREEPQVAKLAEILTDCILQSGK